MQRAMVWCLVLVAGLAACGKDAPQAIDARPADAPRSPDASTLRPRREADAPDEVTGAQLHVLYVVPSDRDPMPGLDRDGTLARTVKAFNHWVQLQLGASFRIDTVDGDVDVTFVRLPITEEAMAVGTSAQDGPTRIRQRLLAALTPAFAAPDKMYVVYYEGRAYGSCGNSDVPSHMPTNYVDGVWRSTFLAAPAPAAATTVTVWSPSELPLPTPPFAAHVGTEVVTVTQLAGTTATLAAPLAQAHPLHAHLAPDSRPADCRQNPFPATATGFGYAAFVGVHELAHALGIVSPQAANYAAPPVAHGHLDATSVAGTADMMYQGDAPGQCGANVSDAALSPCRMDPGHVNYVHTTNGATDLARSVFLEPLPASAEYPPGW